MKNPWKTIGRNVLYQNNFGYTLRDDDVIDPNGNKSKYMVLESNGFVTIMALTADLQLVLIEQWRYPIGKTFVEPPAGHIEEKEDPFHTAKRELLEEVGATSSNWHHLGSFWHGTGSFKIPHHVYLALNVEFVKQPSLDQNERMETFLLPFDLAVRLIALNWFDDEKTTLGILLASNFLK